MNFKGLPKIGPVGSVAVALTYFFAPSPSGADEDAQAFLDAAGITDPTESSAVDGLVVSLKAEALWEKMDAIYPMVGGTSTTCKFNLKNPADSDAAYRLTFVGSNSFSANGVSFPVSGANYANTHFDQANFDASNCSIAVSVKEFDGNGYSQFKGNIELANLSGSALIWVRPGYSPYYSCFGPDWGYDPFSGPSDTGFYVTTRISSTVQKLYLDGSVLLEHTNAVGTPDACEMAIGGDPFYGIGSGSLINFASFGSGLTDAEVAALNTIVQAFQTALGR